MYINYVPVIVAAVVAMILGGIWYTPAVFGNAWMRAIGKGKESMAGSHASMLWMLVATLVMSYVLAHFIGYAGASTPWEGAQVGAWLWLGFIVPMGLSRVLFEKLSMQAFWINVLYYLVSIAVMGAILAGWQ